MLAEAVFDDLVVLEILDPPKGDDGELPLRELLVAQAELCLDARTHRGRRLGLAKEQEEGVAEVVRHVHARIAMEVAHMH